MTNWYILPNGNIKHINGLELQPEKDWLPTDARMQAFTDALRAKGMSDALIIQAMLGLAIAGEPWVQENLSSAATRPANRFYSARPARHSFGRFFAVWLLLRRFACAPLCLSPPTL